MILFFDTETTGLYNDRAAPDDPIQPHIVQLAASLYNDDGRKLSSFCLIIDPGIGDGIDIPEAAAKVHGITNELAVVLGVSLESALATFTHLYQRSDLVVAHNMKFDRAMIETAISRYYGRHMPLRKPLFCTMEAATPIVNLPPSERMIAAGFNKPKPPRLQECIEHFFGEKLTGAHDAGVDVEACARIYFHMKSMGATS